MACFEVLKDSGKGLEASETPRQSYGGVRTRTAKLIDDNTLQLTVAGRQVCLAEHVVVSPAYCCEVHCPGSHSDRVGIVLVEIPMQRSPFPVWPAAELDMEKGTAV